LDRFALSFIKGYLIFWDGCRGTKR
jgi:hypothetical protein